MHRVVYQYLTISFVRSLAEFHENSFENSETCFFWKIMFSMKPLLVGQNLHEITYHRVPDPFFEKTNSINSLLLNCGSGFDKKGYLTNRDRAAGASSVKIGAFFSTSQKSCGGNFASPLLS